MDVSRIPSHPINICQLVTARLSFKLLRAENYPGDLRKHKKILMLLFLSIGMAQAREILQHGRQGPVMVYRQNNGSGWPGDVWSRVIGSRNIHIDFPEYSGSITTRINTGYDQCFIRDLTLNVQGPSYLGLTRSISWLLMPWLLTSPGHQQPWYWLCKIGRFLSYLRKDFNYLRLINVEKWHKV